MNRIKAFGPELEKLCQDISEYNDGQYNKAVVEMGVSSDEYTRLERAASPMWRDEGMISLQKGLMFLTRAVAQPTFF
jgi:hypothetical protein